MKNFMDKFVEALKQRDISEKTVIGYQSDIKFFMQWFEQTNGDELSPELVTPTDVREYKQYLLNVERRKANTINRRLAAISSLMHWAQDVKLIEVNPVENIKPVQGGISAPRWLDKRQQFSLQRAIEQDLQLAKIRYQSRWVTRRRDASIVILMLHTGLRLNECTSLHLEDVTISDRKGEVLVQHGKGERQRRVPLNAEARKAISDWLPVRPNKGDFLWVAVEDEHNHQLSDRTIQRVLIRYGQEAGIENLTPHVLRHTFAKNLINTGVGIEKVAVLLGHSNLNTTRIYTSPSSQDLETAVSGLENT